MFFRKSERLDDIGNEIVRSALDKFGSRGLVADKLSITLLLHPTEGTASFNETAGGLAGFAYRGDTAFYPCSVIKVFYLAALQAALETGAVSETAELDRAAHDMIKWSSNTATNYIIDVLTGTTGDTELPPEAMHDWMAARNRINDYFTSLDLPEFEGINVSQKLMDDDRYGREKIFVQVGGNNHNRLTTNAAASILARIMDGQMVSSARSKIMAGYLHRPRDAAFAQTPGAQVLNYLGANLPAGAEIWSKAGWTGWTRDPLASYRRHDCLHTQLPGGQRLTLAVFTEGQQISTDVDVLPFIGAKAAALVGSLQ